MSAEAYEILSLFMRYAFVLIGFLIVWRSFLWLRRDARAYQKEMRSLPDAGLVGEMVNLATGEAQPLPREGIIGASRECDIRLKGDGVQRVHAQFEFVEGKGLKMIPLHHSRLMLGGVDMQNAGYALHGTQLQIGNTVLRVRLFAGLNVPHPAAYPEPDAVLDANVYLEPWQGGGDGEDLPPYLGIPAAPQQEYVPYSTGAIPPGAPLESMDSSAYDGGYTEDGQMTWQYAYSLDELRAEMEKQRLRRMESEAGSPEDGDEAAPYASPVPRRRRRNRHA